MNGLAENEEKICAFKVLKTFVFFMVLLKSQTMMFYQGITAFIDHQVHLLETE